MAKCNIRGPLWQKVHLVQLILEVNQGEPPEMGPLQEQMSTFGGF